MFGGRRVKRAASSWHEDLRVNVKESEDLLKVELLSSVKERLSFSSLEHNDRRERFDLILRHQNSVSFPNNTKVQFFLEGDTQSLVNHWHVFLISEEEDLGHAGILGSEGVEVGIGDFDDIGMQVLGCHFLQLLDRVILLNEVRGTVMVMTGMGLGG